MPSPVADSYTVASGLPIYGGRYGNISVAPGAGALTLAGYAPSIAQAASWWLGASRALTVFGDSIAAGHNQYVTDFEGTESGDVTATAPYKLARLYDGGSGFNFVNDGIGSTTIASWVGSGQLNTVLGSSPLAVILHIGINDLVAATSFSTMLSGLDSVLTHLVAPTHLFIDEVLPATSVSDSVAANIRTWNTTHLPGWCASNGATVISCHDAMGQTRVSTGLIDNLLTAYNDDNVHPNAAGYTALAALWKVALDAHF